MKRRRWKRWLARAGLAIGLYAVVAIVVAIAMPLETPDSSYAPRAGDRLKSEWEGFEQRFTEVRDGHIFGELILAPGAEGPPTHYHRGFDECGQVVAGTLTVEIEGEVSQHGPGERLCFPAGKRHRPYNPSAETVVLRTEGDGLPLEFATCLAQLYAFADAPGNAGIRLPLQMSLMRGYCDTHVAPPLAEGILYGALAPIARLAGMRSFYPEFRPGARGP